MPADRRFRYTLRRLFVIVFIVAVVIAGATPFYRWFSGYGPIRNIDQWPESLVSLTEQQGVDQSQIRGINLFRNWDVRTIFLIEHNASLIDSFVTVNNLIQCNDSHPVAGKLIQSTPGGWPEIKPNTGTW